MTIAEAMKKARLDKGYSQAKLCQKTGISNACISFYENGIVFPGVLNLIDIADALGITLDELVGRTVRNEKVLQEKTRRT